MGRRARIDASGDTPFAPEAGRYHLYVSRAHRALIAITGRHRAERPGAPAPNGHS